MFSEKARVLSPSRTILSKVGAEAETLIIGQLGAAQPEAWRTGDKLLAKITTGVSVWVGGDGLHVDSVAWEECWSMADKHSPPLEWLRETGKLYWRRQQAGEYQEWDGVVAACDGSVQGTMGAGAVIQSKDGLLAPHAVKVGGEASSFVQRQQPCTLPLPLQIPACPW